MDSTRLTALTDEDLARRLSPLLEPRLGATVVPGQMRRRAGTFDSSAPIEIVTIELGTGAPVEVIVKLLHPADLAHPDKRASFREPRVYRHFFCHDQLPVPGYLGTIEWSADDRAIVLERCQGDDLRYCDIPRWVDAARAFAQVHAATREPVARDRTQLLSGDSTSSLLLFGRDYLRGWLDRAIDVAARRASLGQQLQGLSGCDDLICGHLDLWPEVLVHNDAAPKNVLADGSDPGQGIWIVDWELAGIGCGLLDLAHLIYGLYSDARAAVVESYRSTLPRESFPRATEPYFSATLAAAEAFKAIYRIARADVWGIADDTLGDWIGDLATGVAELAPPSEEKRP